MGSAIFSESAVTTTTTRVCSKCGQRNPLTAEFFHRRDGGFRRDCKSCFNARAAETYRRRRAADPDRENAVRREWAERNRDRRREISRRSARKRLAVHREDINAQRRERYAETAERERAKARRRYKEDPARYRAYALRHHHKHRDESLARTKEWRARNPKRVAEAGRVHYAANRGYYAEKNRKWRRENPDKQRALVAAYRARKRGVFVEHVSALVVLELHDGVCGICGEDVDPFKFEVDHIVPLKPREGEPRGLHTYENVAPSHPVCNRRKKNSGQPS